MDLPSHPAYTVEHAMIASLQRPFASLDGAINTLRREVAESRGEASSPSTSSWSMCHMQQRLAAGRRGARAGC